MTCSGEALSELCLAPQQHEIVPVDLITAIAGLK